MVDRICPYCKQKVDVDKGFHNWKNLFRKPTLEDWITLILLIMLVIAAYLYINERKEIEKYISENCICGGITDSSPPGANTNMTYLSPSGNNNFNMTYLQDEKK